MQSFLLNISQMVKIANYINIHVTVIIITIIYNINIIVH